MIGGGSVVSAGMLLFVCEVVSGGKERVAAVGARFRDDEVAGVGLFGVAGVVIGTSGTAGTGVG